MAMKLTGYVSLKEKLWWDEEEARVKAVEGVRHLGRGDLFTRIAKANLKLDRDSIDLYQRLPSRNSNGTSSAVAPDVMTWATGPDGRCTYVNSIWEDFTGVTFQEALGFAWQKVIHPEDLEKLRAINELALRNRQAFALTHRVRRRDGEYLYVQDHGVPQFNGDGKFLGFSGSALVMPGPDSVLTQSDLK